MGETENGGMKKRKAAKSRRKRQPRQSMFMIYGRMPNADHVLCGHAWDRRTLARRIAQLFKLHPDVIFVEIIFHQTMDTTEAEIRKATGTVRRIKPTLAPPGMTSEGQTLQ
jgi:hypothetical protein